MMNTDGSGQLQLTFTDDGVENSGASSIQY